MAMAAVAAITVAITVAIRVAARAANRARMRVATMNGMVRAPINPTCLR
ncbi:hypothetical protein [Achromobacter aloeverae]